MIEATIADTDLRLLLTATGTKLRRSRAGRATPAAVMGRTPGHHHSPS